MAKLYIHGRIKTGNTKEKENESSPKRECNTGCSVRVRISSPGPNRLNHSTCLRVDCETETE